MGAARLFRKATSPGMTLLFRVATTEHLTRKKDLRTCGVLTFVVLQGLSQLLSQWPSSSVRQGENEAIKASGLR